MMTRGKPKALPADIYIPFVQSLYSDGYLLAWGGLSQSVTALIVYLHNREPAYLFLAFALLAAGLFRYAGIRKRENQVPTSVAQARVWEFDYLVGGTIQGATLGLYCFVALFLRPDPLAEIAAICVTLASAVAIVGRNYASTQMVAILAAFMTLPISAGLILRDDPYSIAIGMLVIPFFQTIVKMSARVRETFLQMFQEKKKVSGLAHRFDRALNTMSAGLIMLDADGKVIVANAEAAHLFGFSSPDRALGRTLRALLMRGVASHLLSRKESLDVEANLTNALREGRGRKHVVSLLNGRHLEFTASEGHDDLSVLTFDDVTARVESEEKIRYMARYDSLTDLPNRAYFYELVGEALASGKRSRNCALAVLDLDDFGTVNDTLGHPIGDALIKAVAARLAAACSETTRVSRFGGDEFMIFMDRVDGREKLSDEIERVMRAMDGGVEVAGHTLKIHASIGAVLGRVNEMDVDAMLVRADLALYKAKELGKNRWQLFEAEMDAEFRRKQVMKADLRAAIENRALRIVYQPIVGLDSMRIASCEALCRWDHPEFGPVSPAVFIPMAEEMGIISEISAFVLSAATAECAKWPSQITVSVNLSAKDFGDRRIVEVVKAALERANLAPERLEIEVTETALLDDKASTRKFLEELKSLGVRIALDDFGTGYSSLSYLHTLPLDKVKIDRSFIEDLTTSTRSQKQLRGVVDLSRSLGMQVTIEGVETFDQLKILAFDSKPDLIQGFLFGAALSASGIETMSNAVWPFADDLKLTEAAVS